MAYIWGRNPVVEALRAGNDVDKLFVAAGIGQAGVIEEILRRARAARVPIQQIDRRALDRMSDGGVHQGVIAEVAEFDYVTVDDLLVRAADAGEPPLLLLLDSVQDPHNLGALIRTADAVGAHGVVVPRHRSAGVTPTVVKSSAGAAEHMPVAQVVNLGRAIDDLKKQGVWVAGLDAAASKSYDEVDWTGPLAIVVGAEGAGLGRLIAERCDFLVKLPMRGHVDSLNASVAGSIVLYQAWRKRSLAMPAPTASEASPPPVEPAEQDSPD